MNTSDANDFTGSVPTNENEWSADATRAGKTKEALSKLKTSAAETADAPEERCGLSIDRRKGLCRLGRFRRRRCVQGSGRVRTRPPAPMRLPTSRTP